MFSTGLFIARQAPDLSVKRLVNRALSAHLDQLSNRFELPVSACDSR
jgi:hypothetical protein